MIGQGEQPLTGDWDHPIGARSWLRGKPGEAAKRRQDRAALERLSHAWQDAVVRWCHEKVFKTAALEVFYRGIEAVERDLMNILGAFALVLTIGVAMLFISKQRNPRFIDDEA